MTRILIVEDEDSVRELSARALLRDGYSIDQAADGLAGLDMIREAGGDYDLVMSDIRMPAMDGIEMARAATSEFPDLRIMLVTGYAEQREGAGLDHVVIDVVRKPFTLAELRSRVAAALASMPAPMRATG